MAILILESDSILSNVEKQYQYLFKKNWTQKLVCHYGVCIALKSKL